MSSCLVKDVFKNCNAVLSRSRAARNPNESKSIGFLPKPALSIMPRFLASLGMTVCEEPGMTAGEGGEMKIGLINSFNSMRDYKVKL